MVNRRDLNFVLNELLQIDELSKEDFFANHDTETFTAVIDAAEALAKNLFEPHAALSDEKEPVLKDNGVSIIPEVAAALQEYYESGFGSAAMPAQWDGMQLPWTVSQACNALFMSANISTASYPLLTNAAANMLLEFGSEKQRARFLPQMLDGRSFGTMCLSEPQAGSSLADIRTRANRVTGDEYQVSGNKMWISCGDHELSENVIHMVLAKIPGGPHGVKGLSLFIVPKFHVQDNGERGERNDVAVAGINHKMGYRGTVNCLLNFGENGRCLGYLIGEPHQGMRYMFKMMNEARIGVGLGAACIGYAGYRCSLAYAKDRPQGRLPGQRNTASPQVPIIDHADIRRLLLSQKASVEGALALCLYCASLVDQSRICTAEKQQQIIELLDILTPIAKSWPAEYCLEANKNAIQVLGGYGYTREYPAERLYRDNRLNAIHEGTHGIQALDLLGRKVQMGGGHAFEQLVGSMEDCAHETEDHPAFIVHSTELKDACHHLRLTTAHLTQQMADGQIDLALANATLYLHSFGHIVIAWMWLRMAVVADKARTQASEPDASFYQGKLSACQYFFRYELPNARSQLRLLVSADDTCLNVPTEAL
nr:3-methylmercaptopropionyl-CoA dehydrogenase-like [Nerophis lumbriciformis]